MLIDQNHKFYFAHNVQNRILRWRKANTTIRPNILSTGPLSALTTMFVTEQGDIYFQANVPAGRILKQSFNDSNNTFYCSIFSQNQISTVDLDGNTSAISTRVGGASWLMSNSIYTSQNRTKHRSLAFVPTTPTPPFRLFMPLSNECDGFSV